MCEIRVRVDDVTVCVRMCNAPVHAFRSLSLCLSLCLSVCLSLCVSVSHCLCLSVTLSVCLSLSVSLSVSSSLSVTASLCHLICAPVSLCLSIPLYVSVPLSECVVSTDWCPSPHKLTARSSTASSRFSTSCTCSTRRATTASTSSNTSAYCTCCRTPRRCSGVARPQTPRRRRYSTACSMLSMVVEPALCSDFRWWMCLERVRVRKSR